MLVNWINSLQIGVEKNETTIQFPIGYWSSIDNIPPMRIAIQRQFVCNRPKEIETLKKKRMPKPTVSLRKKNSEKFI